MAPLKAPPNLPDLVKTAFARAKTNGDLTYFPTQVTILSLNSIPFQLRFSPSLANKPSAPRPKQPSSAPFDPFDSPEKGPLFIAEIQPAHNLVLNKFAVVPEHFILATKQFKQQTHLLEADDLAATLACIEAYHNFHSGADDGELFAFFNSGEHSGASQPHRHVQLLPVAQMKAGLDDPSAWSVLANRLVSDEGVEAPFKTFRASIQVGISQADLHETYISLYRQAIEAVKASGIQEKSDGDHSDVAEISYNMAMTRSSLVICPRLAEGAAVTSDDGEPVGKLALNGTVLAGTALVKSEAEWDAMRTNVHAESGGPAKLADILAKIGLPTGIGRDGKL